MNNQISQTKNKMRVAIDSQVFGGQRYGGVSRYFTQLCSHLNAQGCNTKIFAPVHCNRYLSTLSKAEVEGLYIESLPTKLKRAVQPLNTFISRPLIARWKPDLVHESYYANRGVAPRGVPTVVTVLDMIHEKFSSGFSRFDNTSERKRRSVERADHIICISENTKMDLQELWGIGEDKISVVYLGCQPLTDIHFDPYRLSSGRSYLLYVANRAAYKNFTVLLDAFSESRRIRENLSLVVFGGGAFTVEEKRKIAEAGIDEEYVVQLEGGDALLASLYAGATAFIYPSFYEGFGLSPLEAMIHCCPVISSNSSCLPEVLGSSALFFSPESPGELAHRIESVMDSSVLVQDLITRGRVQASKYTWNRCASETEAVYRMIL